jgi:competence protein ComEA
MKARIKNYLSITKKEWNGLVILIILIALVLAAPYVYQLLHKDNTINFKDFDKAVAQLSKGEVLNPTYKSSAASYNKVAHPVMFPFNPNLVTTQQWQALGLSEHVATIIKHYLAKGGHFYKKEDLKKIYGLTADDYTRLQPYINLSNVDNNQTEEKTSPAAIVELNSADSTALTHIMGLNPSSAVQIIRYRRRLGGFYHKEQLMEVYGIDSLRYHEIENRFSIDPGKVIKIPINTISFNQLRLFPYLSYKQGSAIIEYRREHGNYTSIADMKNIAILDDGILRKIEPYLSFK